MLQYDLFTYRPARDRSLIETKSIIMPRGHVNSYVVLGSGLYNTLELLLNVFNKMYKC